MKRFRRVLTALLAAALALPLAGCWNYREVESLYIVSGIAVDLAAAPNRYRLTFEVLELAGSGEKNGCVQARLISADGETIADAVKNASKISKNELYFSDCKLAVFSSAVAEEGLTPVLDWFNRDPGPRFNMQLFVAKGSSAAELFRQESSGEPVSSRISEAMELAVSSGLSPGAALYQADNILLGEGKDLLLPCLCRNAQGASSGETEISGSAVFLGDRCVGYLTEEQTKTDLFALSGESGGLLLTGERGRRTAALQVQKSSADIRPDAAEGRPAVDVAVTAECMFDEENSPENLLAQMGADGISRLAEETLERELSQEIARVQAECGCDIYGFGRQFSRLEPALWEKLRPDWRGIFRTLEVRVTVKVHINNSGFAHPKGG